MNPLQLGDLLSQALDELVCSEELVASMGKDPFTFIDGTTVSVSEIKALRDRLQVLAEQESMSLIFLNESLQEQG